MLHGEQFTFALLYNSPHQIVRRAELGRTYAGLSTAAAPSRAICRADVGLTQVLRQTCAEVWEVILSVCTTMTSDCAEVCSIKRLMAAYARVIGRSAQDSQLCCHANKLHASSGRRWID